MINKFIEILWITLACLLIYSIILDIIKDLEAIKSMQSIQLVQSQLILNILAKDL